MTTVMYRRIEKKGAERSTPLPMTTNYTELRQARPASSTKSDGSRVHRKVRSGTYLSDETPCTYHVTWKLLCSHVLSEIPSVAFNSRPDFRNIYSIEGSQCRGPFKGPTTFC
jgi:hypothetical protein